MTLAFAATPVDGAFLSFRLDSDDPLLILVDSDEMIPLGRRGTSFSWGFTAPVVDEDSYCSHYSVYDGLFTMHAEVFDLPANTAVVSGTGRFTRISNCFSEYEAGDLKVQWVHPVLLSNLGLPSNLQRGVGFFQWYTHVDFYLEAVPEPSTALLIGLTSVGLFALRRLRRS
jgi:hypothetical protein